jgi:hypothetical protein
MTHFPRENRATLFPELLYPLIAEPTMESTKKR